MPVRDASQRAFATAVAAQTGLDPYVVLAWTSIEDADAPGGTGGFNYLNVRPNGSSSYSGVQLAGVSPGGFQRFRSLSDAVTETVYWVKRMPNYAGIRGSVGKPAATQIAAIAASPWDQGHYGGNGRALAQAYVLLRLPGSSPSSGGISTGSVPGFARGVAGGLQGAVNTGAAVVGSITSVGDAIKWVFDNWDRVLEVLGGFVLALVGALALARQQMASPPAAARAIPA